MNYLKLNRECRLIDLGLQNYKLNTSRRQQKQFMMQELGCIKNS
jgi:hypothetical protein